MLVRFTISGPTIAASTPPAITSEMARGRGAGAATSAAAKRKCWAMPQPSPAGTAPRQYSGKLPYQTPSMRR